MDTSTSLSSTAAALQQLAALAGTTPASWFHFLIALIVGALAAVPVKNYLKLIISASPNPLVRFGSPVIVGIILSTVGAFALKTWGVTPQDATLAFTSFISVFETLQSGGFGQFLSKAVSAFSSDAPTLEKIGQGILSSSGQPAAAAALGVIGQAIQGVVAIHAASAVPVAPAPAPALIAPAPAPKLVLAPAPSLVPPPAAIPAAAPSAPAPSQAEAPAAPPPSQGTANPKAS